MNQPGSIDFVPLVNPSRVCCFARSETLWARRSFGLTVLRARDSLMAKLWLNSSLWLSAEFPFGSEVAIVEGKDEAWLVQNGRRQQCKPGPHVCPENSGFQEDP
jgi:hypothetical protein